MRAYSKRPTDQRFKVHPTFGVMVLKKAKTAEHFAYWNYHQQMYSYEQQFSISYLGIVSTQLAA